MKLCIGNSLEYPGSGPFYIPDDVHRFMLGATGTGKSTVMLKMIVHDFRVGHGVFVFEPHGQLADSVLKRIPKRRTNGVVVIDPTTPFSVGVNPLASSDPEKAVEDCNDIFLGIWGEEAFGNRSQWIFRNYAKALIEVVPNATLLHLLPMVADFEYAKTILEQSTKPTVKQFYKQFSELPARERKEALSPLANKLDKFFSNEYARAIFGHPKSINIGEHMNAGHIVVVRLAKGRLGDELTAFILSVLLSMVRSAAFEREAIPYKDRKQVNVYVDEFHNCSKGHAPESFLSETRKYRVFFTPADQTIAQLPKGSAEAIFGNVGVKMIARVGAKDAEEVSSEMVRGNPAQFQGLQMGQWIIQSAEDGSINQSRLVQVEPETPWFGDEQDPYEVLKQSARRWGRPRSEVLEYADGILS